jgi:CRP/FNR family transcriptional regulator, cyclic AMP receptor protein
VTSLLELSADLPSVEIAPGELLIEEGTNTRKLWVLVSGAVVIERDGVAFARVDVPGAVLGEMSALLDRPASASVRAATGVTVRVADDPTLFLTRSPGAALEVLRATASRLDGMTRYLVDVKRQFAEAEGHLGMVDRILDTLLHHQPPHSSPGSRRDPEGDHEHESHEGQDL